MSTAHKELAVRWISVIKHLSIDLQLSISDRLYIYKRLKHEGLSFLTVQLPKFAKWIICSIEAGELLPPTLQNGMTSFSWIGSSPRFCRGWTQEIFKSKRLLNRDGAAVALSLWKIRQLCEYLYKLSLEFYPEQLETAEHTYRETETSVSAYSKNLDHIWVERLRKNFETHYPSLSRLEVHEIYSRNRPRHGPGSVVSDRSDISAGLLKRSAEAISGTCSRDQRAYSGYFRPYPSYRATRVNAIAEGRECHVLYVPKDSRGPRVISKEPMHLLRGQLAFLDYMIPALAQATCGSITIADQTGNRTLAKQGSIDKSYSTYDLKEASDRVSHALCKGVFRNSPAFRYFVTQGRATHAVLRSGDRIRLAKLSGMGSGLTFPIMSLLIQLSICTVVSSRTGTPYAKAKRCVRVYGDDVIVPREWGHHAEEGLLRSGFAINYSKSFHRSFFRESCGGDYYSGQEVAPVRLKLTGAGLGLPRNYPKGFSIKPSRRRGFHFSGAVLAIERHCRELVKNGLVSLASYYYDVLEAAIGPLPLVSGASPVLGRYTLFPTEIGDETIRGLVPYGVTENRSVCPYKVLGDFFKSREPGTSIPYGVVPVPHKVLIKYREVSGPSLRGRIAAP